MYPCREGHVAPWHSTPNPPGPMTFTVTTSATSATISTGDVAGLLVGAIEGGSNYWYMLESYTKAPSGCLDYEGVAAGNATWIILDAEEPEDKLTLDRAAMQRGLQAMADKYPWHMENLLQDNADAETSDVFLQCSLFGEVVFG